MCKVCPIIARPNLVGCLSEYSITNPSLYYVLNIFNMCFASLMTPKWTQKTLNRQNTLDSTLATKNDFPVHVHILQQKIHASNESLRVVSLYESSIPHLNTLNFSRSSNLLYVFCRCLDPRLHQRSKVPNQPLHGPCSSISQRADRMPLDLFCQFPQHVDFF